MHSRVKVRIAGLPQAPTGTTARLGLPLQHIARRERRRATLLGRVSGAEPTQKRPPQNQVLQNHTCRVCRRGRIKRAGALLLRRHEALRRLEELRRGARRDEIVAVRLDARRQLEARRRLDGREADVPEMDRALVVGDGERVAADELLADDEELLLELGQVVERVGARLGVVVRRRAEADDRIPQRFEVVVKVGYRSLPGEVHLLRAGDDSTPLRSEIKL